MVVEFYNESAKQVQVAMRRGVGCGARRGRSAPGGGWCSKYFRGTRKVGRSYTSIGCADDITSGVTKRGETKVAWRRATWDEDWRKVDEQCRASVREMEMAVVQAKLAVTSQCVKSACACGETDGL